MKLRFLRRAGAMLLALTLAAPALAAPAPDAAPEDIIPISGILDGDFAVIEREAGVASLGVRLAGRLVDDAVNQGAPGAFHMLDNPQMIAPLPLEPVRCFFRSAHGCSPPFRRNSSAGISISRARSFILCARQRDE